MRRRASFATGTISTLHGRATRMITIDTIEADEGIAATFDVMHQLRFRVRLER